MNFTLHIWRQKNTQSAGKFLTYEINDIDSDTSFLEMLDHLNDYLSGARPSNRLTLLTLGETFRISALSGTRCIRSKFFSTKYQLHFLNFHHKLDF